MRKRLCAVFIGAILLLFTLSGCWNNKQINSLAFVMGVAVDMDEQGNEYEVTAQIARPGALGLQSGGGGDDKAYTNLTQSGIGIEKAFANIAGQTNRMLYASHNQVIVISMATAKENITPILDYFARSSDVRFTETLYIAEGDAKDFLDVAGDLEKLPVTYLRQLGETRLGPGEISENSLIRVLNGMLSKTSAPMISVLKLVADDSGEKRVELSGMAVIKGNSVCTVLDKPQTESVMMVHGKSKDSIWQIDIFGGYMTLKIVDTKADITPVFSGDELEKIRVDMDVGCSIVDMSGKADVLSMDTREQIADVLKDEFLKTLRETFQYTQGYSADVYGFGDMLYRFHEQKTRGLVENWDTVYPNLQAEFNVSVEVLSTGSIIRPLEMDTEGNNQ